MALVYSKHFEIRLAGLERAHPFDVHKYSKIARGLVKDGLVSPEQFHVPEELTREQMLLVHTPEYLDSLHSSAAVARYLEAPLAAVLPGRLIDRAVLRAFRHASGGTILAARLALERRVAVNLGGGYHHAKPDAGEGFCIYADIPIAIRLLQNEGLIRRALVVDLDVHQGNGTAVCFRGDDSVFTFSMHQADIYPTPKEKSDCDVELDPGTDDQTYLGILRQALPEVLDRSRADLVILQAGCDTLAGDPLASLAMTPDGIARRDGCVVETCLRRGVPVAMTLGGGYSREAWEVQQGSIRRILETHGEIS